MATAELVGAPDGRKCPQPRSPSVATARGAEGGSAERAKGNARTLPYCSIRTSIDHSRLGLQCRDQLGRGEDLMLLRADS
jgi:hypothetical protein